METLPISELIVMEDYGLSNAILELYVCNETELWVWLVIGANDALTQNAQYAFVQLPPFGEADLEFDTGNQGADWGYRIEGARFSVNET